MITQKIQFVSWICPMFHNDKVSRNTWLKTKKRKILCKNPWNTESFVFDSTVKTAAICDFAECDSAKRKKGKKTRRRAKEQKSDRQNRRREQFSVVPNQCKWKDVPLKKIQWLHAYLTFIMTSKLSEKLQKLKGMSHFHNWISNLSRNNHGPPIVYLSKLLSHVKNVLISEISVPAIFFMNQSKI